MVEFLIVFAHAASAFPFLDFSIFPLFTSMDWLKGKSTGNHGFYMFLSLNMEVSCKFSHPIL
jgi:hypothetical protein